MSSGNITTENIKNLITTAFNTDALNNVIPYIIPHFIPGNTDTTEMVITTENIKNSITTEC